MLLTSAVIWNQGFCKETRLCNSFKIANAITLAQNILESAYKVLQDLWKGTIFTQPVNCHDFCLILTKVAKLHLQSTLKCLKTGQKRYSYNHPIKDNEPWQFWKKNFFKLFKYWKVNTTQSPSKGIFSL